MNNEQIYSILSQGLDIATQKGCFNLNNASQIANALFHLNEILNPVQKQEVLNLIKKEDDSIKAE
jgi:hypothetical protein